MMLAEANSVLAIQCTLCQLLVTGNDDINKSKLVPFEEFDAIGFLGVEQQVEGQTFLKWKNLDTLERKVDFLLILLIYPRA